MAMAAVQGCLLQCGHAACFQSCAGQTHMEMHLECMDENFASDVSLSQNEVGL